MPGAKRPWQNIYPAASSIFSMKIPYPLVGSFTSTCVTAPTIFPFWQIGEPDTSDCHYGQHFLGAKQPCTLNAWLLYMFLFKFDKLEFVGLLKTKLQGAPIGSIGIFIFRQQEKTV